MKIRTDLREDVGVKRERKWSYLGHNFNLTCVLYLKSVMMVSDSAKLLSDILGKDINIRLRVTQCAVRFVFRSVSSADCTVLCYSDFVF